MAAKAFRNYSKALDILFAEHKNLVEVRHKIAYKIALFTKKACPQQWEQAFYDKDDTYN